MNTNVSAPSKGNSYFLVSHILLLSSVLWVMYLCSDGSNGGYAVLLPVLAIYAIVALEILVVLTKVIMMFFSKKKINIIQLTKMRLGQE
ncbi:hypothetical protein SKA34_08818 [Photobacterium sp. SKA34]|nr:hypothetical protein SKA34_08818 [Photobacterium sp. SKA34]